ncbi:alpha/beta hydrolase [Aurantivibrio infirmus]
MGQNKLYKSAQSESEIKAKYNELLRHWPIAKEELVIETRHGKTFIIACGNPDNPPLFLLHGASNNSIIWMEDIDLLCKTHRVFAIDIIGEANHSAANRPHYKSTAYVDWMDDIFSQLSPKEAVVIGSSLGAWIALQFTCQWPDRVSRLVLINPPGISKKKRLLLKRFFLFFLAGWGQKILFNKIRAGANTDPRINDFLLQIHKRFKPKLKKLPLLKDQSLARILCPVLLILGEKDIYFSPAKTLARLARNIMDLHVRYRKNQGHSMTGIGVEIDRFLLSEFPPD